MKFPAASLLPSAILMLSFCFAAAQPTNSPGVPPPPPSKSPVETFRELLAMSPAERRHALADRPPETQNLILAKVRAYESMKPDQRELRLQATELKWYLLPLLSSPATNRAVQLASIPTNYQRLIADRLILWDQLSVQDQTNLLRNQAMVAYLTEVAEQKGNDTLSPSRLDHLRKGIPEWHALTEQEREHVKERFAQFFQFTPAEQERALNNLSDSERQQIEKTLVNYSNLSPSQRAQCIRSFEKFANLTPEERQQFLKNADRWKRMAPAERDSWRKLVNTLLQQPPLPPGLSLPPLPPPLPPHLTPRSAVATN